MDTPNRTTPPPIALEASIYLRADAWTGATLQQLMGVALTVQSEDELIMAR